MKRHHWVDLHSRDFDQMVIDLFNYVPHKGPYPHASASVAERNRNWLSLFAHAAHRIDEAGCPVTVVTSLRDKSLLRLDIPLADGRYVCLVLDKDSGGCPFIFFRFMPFDSLYLEDVVRPIFCDSEVLREFDPYRASFYSHPLTGSDEEIITLLVRSACAFISFRT